MRKLFIIPVLAILFAACQGAPEADKTTTADKQEVLTAKGDSYSIDTVASLVTWTGSKPVGRHTGTFKIDSGVVSVADGKLQSGKVVINVVSLTDIEQKPGEGKEKLEGHLKSADFFDVAKFPTAVFEVTKAEPLANDTSANYTISGNLTLKDSTKNVTFPAKVDIADGKVSLKANFNIDRTAWGMHYGNDKSLGDKFILPEVNLQLNVSAKK